MFIGLMVGNGVVFKINKNKILLKSATQVSGATVSAQIKNILFFLVG